MTVTPTLDGVPVFNIVGNTAATTTATFTTSLTNDIVILDVAMSDTGAPVQVSSVSAMGLTFQKRSRNLIAWSTPFQSGADIIERWWSPAASAFSGAISIILSGPPDTWNYCVYAFTGVGNITHPWDTNPSLVAVRGDGTNTDNFPNITLSTNNPPGVILANVCSGVGGRISNAPPGFFTLANQDNRSGINVELTSGNFYSNYPSALLNTNIQCTDNVNWLMTGDAITGVNTTAPTPSMAQACVG